MKQNCPSTGDAHRMTWHRSSHRTCSLPKRTRCPLPAKFSPRQREIHRRGPASLKQSAKRTTHLKILFALRARPGTQNASFSQRRDRWVDWAKMRRKILRLSRHLLCSNSERRWLKLSKPVQWAEVFACSEQQSQFAGHQHFKSSHGEYEDR